MPADSSLLFSDRVVDLIRGEVRWSGGEHRLTHREVALLSYLSRQIGAVVSRDTLLTEVWGHAPDSLSRAVDLAVRRLRTKLEPTPRQPRHLLTVFGEGYRLVGVQRALPATNLAAPLDKMIGRDEVLASLVQVVSEGCRALALVGPFGIGKTRLAEAVGRSVLSSFRGGVWRCDLEGCASVSDAAAVIARALHLEADAAQLGARLADRAPTLLLLDGLDALPASATEAITGWLRQAPRLSVVVTARRRLRIPGGRLVEVPPLPPAEAVALLVARAASSGRVLSAEDAACQQLAARLDGLPLAIELAAVQTRALSLSALQERLDAALFPGLEGVLRTAWEALSAEERALLAGCAVFAGSFTVEAAEAVMGHPILVPLAALQERSLVLAAPGARVRLRLMGSVRAFVHQRSPAAGPQEAFIRWAVSEGTRLAAWVNQTGSSDAWAQLDAERDNLLAAWRAASPEQQRRLVWAMGPLLKEIPEALSMIDAALQVEATGPLHLLRGRALRIRGRLPEAEAALRAAVELLPEGAVARRMARMSAALIDIDRGNYDVAIAQLAELEQAEPPDVVAADALIHRGQVLYSLGQATPARRAVLQGIDVLQGLGAGRRMATAYNILSDLYVGEKREAFVRQALQMHRAEGNLRGESVTLAHLANVLADAERWDEMWTVAEAARAAHQALGARRSEGILLSNLCAIALSRWEVDRAEALGHQALRICRAYGIDFFEAQTLLNLGISALIEQRLDEALARLREARALFGSQDNAVMIAVVEGMIGAAEASLDQIDAATARFAAVRESRALRARPTLRACVILQEGFVELARARAQPDDAAGLLAAARARITGLEQDPSLEAARRTTEVRGVRRLLEEAIARAEA